MKKILFLMAMAVMSVCAVNAQQYKVYCELIGTQKGLGNKVTISVDFGQKQKLFSNQTLVDETGKALVFNSMVDAMNFMGELGWEFEQAYVVTKKSQTSMTNVYHWLLSRYISEDEAIDAGFKTRNQYKKEVKNSGLEEE